MFFQLAWYLIWETILNVLAELTHFADRNFYDAWWNSGALLALDSYLLVSFGMLMLDKCPGTNSHEAGTVLFTSSSYAMYTTAPSLR